jgi:hypothetical protein
VNSNHPLIPPAPSTPARNSQAVHVACPSPSQSRPSDDQTPIERTLSPLHPDPLATPPERSFATPASLSHPGVFPAQLDHG